MKYLFFAFLITSTGTAYSAPMTFDEAVIKEVEKKYLEKYKNLSDRQKQEKYLIAISELCEVGDFKGALYLAESGYKLKNITIEYYDVFLTLLKQYGAKERYNEVFNDLFKDSFKVKTEEEKSTIGDMILDYMLLNSTLPFELKPRIENIYKSIQFENFIKRADLVKAIIYSRKEKYKDALALTKVTESSGLEELLFIAFLEKMNDKPITVKTQPLINIYGGIIKIIEATPRELVVKTIKGHEDIMEETPLFEALK